MVVGGRSALLRLGALACVGVVVAQTDVFRAVREASPDPDDGVGVTIPVLGVASIFHASYLLRCIRSIDAPVSTLVVVHNGRDPEVAAAVETLQRERPAMKVVRVPDNSGCAGGWNRIISAAAAAPWWLIVNDDIAFPPGSLAKLAQSVWPRVRTRPSEGHFKFTYQHNATGWSCFALTRTAVLHAGVFDENVFPVYYEDQDYEWRLARAGLASVHLDQARASPAASLRSVRARYVQAPERGARIARMPCAGRCAWSTARRMRASMSPAR